MAKKSYIDKQIKESFEQLHSSAPESLWGKISDNIDESESTLTIEKQIRDSFRSLNNRAPEHVWHHVNRQLYIDSSWKGIKQFLDKRTALKKSLRIAAVFLFLLIPSSGRYIFNLNYQSEYFSAAGEFEFIKEQDYLGEHPGERKNTQNRSLKKAHTLITDKQDKSEKNSSASESIPKITNANFFSSKKNIAAELNKNDTLQISVAHISLKNAPISYPDSLKRQLLFVFNKELPAEAGNTEFSGANKGFEIGITYAFNNTWLLNNNTRNSFVKTSTISSDPAFTHNYGILLYYNLSEAAAVGSEFYLNSKIKQKYGVYEEGKFYKKELDLSYSKLTLSYRYNFNNNNFNSPNYTIKPGMYLARLNSMTEYSNKTISSVAKKYTNYDYGIKVGIGREHKFNKLIIAYGLNAEYGLRNIFIGNRLINKEFNNTRNSDVGFYVSFRYKI